MKNNKKSTHALALAAAPAIRANGVIDPEPLYMQPAPFYLAENTALHQALFITDNAGDPLTG